MKNLHVLPTDKPTKLHYHNGLFLSPNFQLSTSINSVVRGKNIYITSNEEIKEGNWCYDKVFNLIFQTDNHTDFKYANQTDYVLKIILTTDGDLIKDGVQTIDDIFLQWFVNNSNCKEVEVISLRKSSGYYDEKEVWHWDFLGYKIIIPKEESKVRVFGTKNDTNFWSDKPIQEQSKQTDEKGLDYMINLDDTKQQTIEEAAEKYSLELLEAKTIEPHQKSWIKSVFTYIAKWQAERMYSEEDMKLAFDAGHKKGFSGYPNTENWKELPFKEWFERFKKQ